MNFRVYLIMQFINDFKYTIFLYATGVANIRNRK